MGNSRMLL